jgi:hypothetical protein
MRFDEPPDLPLCEAEGVFKQLFIGLVDELNHLYTRDDNYREAPSQPLLPSGKHAG